jgi:hypothetical protein
MTGEHEVELVMNYLKKQEKNPINMSRVRKSGCDIKCGDQLIEVKKRDLENYSFIFLTHNEFDKFLKDKSMCLYVVYRRDGKEKLKIFDRDTVIGNSKESIRYRILLRKAIKEDAKEIEL